MYTRAELKQNAKSALKGKWGSAILTVILSGIIIWVITAIVSFLQGTLSVGMMFGNFDLMTASLLNFIISVLFSLIQVAVIAPITVGVNHFFLSLSEDNKPEVGEIFNGFKFSSINSMITGILISVYTFLWSLLLIIPGIIKGFSYSMAYYIIAENPNMSAKEAINKSMELMNGHKMELFFLELSFLGWQILTVFTCGIGLLWLVPYMNKTTANFYQAIKNDSVVANVN